MKEDIHRPDPGSAPGRRACRLTELLTILATIDGKTRHRSWQDPISARRAASSLLGGKRLSRSLRVSPRFSEQGVQPHFVEIGIIQVGRGAEQRVRS